MSLANLSAARFTLLPSLEGATLVKMFGAIVVGAVNTVLAVRLIFSY